MASSLAKLVIELEANFAKFNSSFDQLQSKVNKGAAAITSSFKKIAGFTLAGLSVGKIISDMKKIGDEAKALEKLSIRFNIDPTQFSAMQYAAKKAGMEVELFNRGVQFMAKNISNAAIGIEEMVVTEDGLLEMSGKAGQAIQELGLNLNLLSRLPIDVQLKAIVMRLGEMEDESRRVAVAMDIFGKGGGGFATMGAEGLGKMIANMEKARTTGKAFTQEQMELALSSKRAISDMEDSWAGLRRELISMAGPLSMIMDFFTWIIQKSHIAVDAIGRFAKALAGTSVQSNRMVEGALSGGIWEMETPGAPAAKEEIPPAIRKRFEGYLAAGKAMDDLKSQYPELFIEGGRLVKGGGGGGGAAGPDPFEQLARTLESLKTEKLSLVGTEFQKIDEWVRKTMEDINQWGDLGEMTAEAVATATSIAAEKKKNVESEFLNWVADQTGDYATTISKQIDEMAKKWGNLPGAMQAFSAFRTKEETKKGSEYEQSRLNLTKSFIDELAGASPLLTEQLRLKESALALDIQIGRERLKLLQFEPWMTKELWAQSNALAAQVEKAKAIALAREKLMTQGVGGGWQAWGLQRQIAAETRPAQMMIDTMNALEQEMGAGMANAIIGALRGKRQDFSEVFFSMAESGLKRAMTGLTATLLDLLAPKPIITPVITAGALNVGTINAGMTMGGIGAGGGIGEMLGGAWDWFTGLFAGFQSGGRFTVGGPGGLDKSLVAFRATRGETVTVTPSGQSSSPTVFVNQTFVTPSPAEFKASRTQIAAQSSRELRDSLRHL